MTDRNDNLTTGAGDVGDPKQPVITLAVSAVASIFCTGCVCIIGAFAISFFAGRRENFG